MKVMEVTIERRVKLAASTLNKKTTEALFKSIDFFKSIKSSELLRDSRISFLSIGYENKIYMYKPGGDLRIIFTINEERIEIIDIALHGQVDE